MTVGRAWIWPTSTVLGAVGTRSLTVAVMSRLRWQRFRAYAQPFHDLLLIGDLVRAEAAAWARKTNVEVRADQGGPAREHHHPVGEKYRLVHVVGDEDHG